MKHPTLTRLATGTFTIGLLFGVVLHGVGFSSWDETQRMFRFTDLRLILIFGGAVSFLALSWKLLSSRIDASIGERRIHRGTLPGALLFGVGWALCGACPSIAVVQLGEGKLLALLTICGMFAGNWLFAVLNERWLRWSGGSCRSD